MKRLLFAALFICLAHPVWAQPSNHPLNQQAVDLVWLPAHRGDAEAQYKLGLLYGSGNGVAKNLTEAARWYRRAAEQGHAKAQAMLGLLFKSGLGVPRSQTEAIKWWRRAAKQGDPDARFNLGMAYWKGEGVTQDFDQANTLFRSMAPAGNPYARSMLGTRSVPRSANPPASKPPPKRKPEAARLERPHDMGTGRPNPTSPGAFQRYLSAAEAGDTDAQSQVGYMYAVGLGVERNFIEAHKWSNIAAALLPHGTLRDVSMGNRNAAAAQMTAPQILRAQRLARDWLAAFEGRQNK